MQTISLPYGKKALNLNIPENKLKGILVSSGHQQTGIENQKEIVKNALKKPVKTPKLRELARGKDKITIISSDHTRPVPSKITMPLILDEIRQGNSEVDITILVATGFHRPSTEKELIAKYGEEIFNKEKIIVHNSKDKKNMVSLGSLPSGDELKINKAAVNCDLLVAEGFIEPHFFAGFSGGRKSVLPGIASAENIMVNHCSEYIKHEKARAGILKENPLNEEMISAARKAGLDFILNVVLNNQKEIIKAFAGHFEKAHQQGCNYVAGNAGVSKKPADIVITTNGGYPLDQNIYQTVKSLSTAEATCKKGGVIIAVSECSDGHGGESFYNTFAQSNSIAEIRKQIINRPKHQTIPDQWETQILARILADYEVILVSEVDKEIVENMFIHWASDVKNAINKAEKLLGTDDYEITVIPDGISVIIN